MWPFTLSCLSIVKYRRAPESELVRGAKAHQLVTCSAADTLLRSISSYPYFLPFVLTTKSVMAQSTVTTVPTGCKRRYRLPWLVHHQKSRT
jgi:hypothetical protein